MADYYLKIPSKIRTWYPGVAPSNWREAIFEDVTERGNRLVLERLPPNDEGDRLALHGDRFFVQVGRDKDRFDALYVIRIEPAENNLPRSTPRNVQCRINLWTGGSPVFKDPVGSLFGAKTEAQGSQSDDDEEPSPEQAQPSPLLLSVLPQASGAIRQRFRPGHHPAEPPDAPEFLQSLSATWRRRRLEQFMTTSARQESLLKGVVKPPNLGRKERDGLLALFGFGALNKAVLQHRYDPERFFLILEDFGRLSLPHIVRATLWTSMLEGLTSSALREELFAASDGLKTLAFDGVPAERAWEEGLLRALKQVAAKQNDAALREVAEHAESAEDPAAHIALWASNLGFERAEPVLPSAPEPALASRAPQPPIVAADSHPADVWAFRTAGPDAKTVEGIRLALAKVLEGRNFLSAPIGDMSALLSLIDVLHQVRDNSTSWLAELPAHDLAVSHLAAANQVYEKVLTLLGDAPRLLMDTLTPQDVDGIGVLLQSENVLRLMPSWLWSVDESHGDAENPGNTLTDLALRLADPECRRRVGSVLAMVDQLGETRALSWLDPPGPGQDPDGHIAIWFERTRELLSNAPADVLHWLRSGEASSSDVAAIERSLSERDQIRTELNADVGQAVEEHLSALESHAEQREWISGYLAAIESYREQFGNPSEMSYSGLRKKAEKELRSNSGQTAGAEVDSAITAEHNWIEASAKATLVYHQPDPAVDFGMLSAPIVLETRQPRQLDVKLNIDVKGDHRNAWPKEWPEVAPASPFTVPAYGWQLQPDTDRWQYPLALRIPIRKPRAESDARLEVNVQATEAHRGSVLGTNVVLRWESIKLTMPPLELRWAGTTNPDYVRSHPIGPQAQVSDIMGRLRAGGSVAVIAPRRFGKSTLVEFLLKDGAEHGLLVPPAIVCTEYATAAGLDYDRLWAGVSDWFYRNLNASLPPGHSGLLPDVHGFDHIRKAASQKGFNAIVLLFDESQLFFPQNDGPALGSRLKNLLERHWSRTDTKDMAALLFGFIGLPTMRERAGADLMGLLAPIERSVISETELRRLIAGMTTGMQTTRAARARLAEVAGNLFILRVLLDRLVSRLRADSRVWASSDDVLSVERELKRELLAGREEDVARYIRDALNRAERITDWDPVPAFGVAAALAELRGEGRVQVESISRLVSHLNEWCRLNATDENVRALYDSAAVDRHLIQLRERRVLKELEFSSGLLEAWLQGVARQGAYPGFQAALLRGAQRRIELPPGAEQVARGGQAEIWRAAAPDGKGQVAYRIRQLASSTEEQQFQSTVEMFEVLRTGVLRREPGSDGLADVLDIGLSALDPTKAILVYRWIDGQDLSGRLGQLPADIVVDLGSRLCRALALIHSRNILHRDISPVNIVLDDSLMRPVLIDFGFARRVGVDMQTKLAGEFCAPEVRLDRPVWTKAADIYSLAATLRSLLRPDATAEDLDSVLQEGLAERPEDRPAAESLLEKLESLERNREIERKRQDAWIEVRNAIEADKHKPWFSGVVTKFRPHFEAMTLGFYPQCLQRYRQIADFLNQSLEAYPHAGLTLKRLAVEDPSNPSLSALLVVRNMDAHAGSALGREAREALQRFQSAGSEKQRALMTAGVQTVSEQLRLNSLPILLSRFI